MTRKPFGAVNIGLGPIVIGHAAPLPTLRFVHHAAGADDLAEEGVTAS